MVQDLHSGKVVNVAEYLFTRLRQLSVQSVFGVPGDYNLRLLDFVASSGLHWVGNCNELNAAYAADGYARMNGLAALVTTFGVGELSAINGIAGAYAERAPVVHIVGTPSRQLQTSRALVHHTFADGEYRRFAAMHAHVTVAQCNLTDPRTAPQEIDSVLQEALLHSRPVYIEVPYDVVDSFVSASNLESPITPPPLAPVSALELRVLARVIERVPAAKRPLILVDGESRPLGILSEIERLVKRTEWPTWTTPFGKSLVNEELSNVYGLYTGQYGDEQCRLYFESADLVIHLGPHPTNTNSQNGEILPNPTVCVSLTHNAIQVGEEIFRDINSQRFLSQLLKSLEDIQIPRFDRPPKPSPTLGKRDAQGLITQKHFYRFVNPLIRAGDIVLAETGTASYGGRTFILPADCTLFGANTWLSIGYMLPATLGTALARRDANKASGAKLGNERAILLIGDGSLQMSVQEISTMIRENVDVVLFVINNGGYTIERAIHGKDQQYNDIATWKHADALGFFGDTKDHAATNSFVARTWGELDDVLKSEEIQKGSGVRLVEVFMGREDCEGKLLELLQMQTTNQDN